MCKAIHPRIISRGQGRSMCVSYSLLTVSQAAYDKWCKARERVKKRNDELDSKRRKLKEGTLRTNSNGWYQQINDYFILFQTQKGRRVINMPQLPNQKLVSVCRPKCVLYLANVTIFSHGVTIFSCYSLQIDRLREEGMEMVRKQEELLRQTLKEEGIQA